MPSRRNAILFFIFTLILAGGVVVWHFFLNRGFVEISGPAPFTVSMNVFNKNECATSPCKISLRPKAYHLTGIKEGYFDTEEDVEVKLFRTKELTFNFQFKPTVTEIGETKLPEKIPKNASKVLFSDSKRKAVVWLGKEQYLYEQTLLSKILLPEHEAILWGNDEKLLILTRANENEQRFLAVEPADLKKDKVNYSIITSFKRALIKPMVTKDPEGRKIIFQDTKGTYLVDIEKKSKQSLDLPMGVNKIRLVGENFVLISWAEGNITLVALETIMKRGERFVEIPALNEQALAGAYHGKFFFVSAEPSPSREIGIPISEIFSTAKNNLEKTREETVKSDRWYFLSYDPQKDNFLTLASMAIKSDEVFQSFDPAFTDKGIFFETLRGTKKIRYFLQLDK